MADLYTSTPADLAAIQNALGITPSVAPPASPQANQIWLSKSLEKLGVSDSASDRMPLGLGGQEQTVWIYNGYLYNLYTGGTRQVIRVPLTADPLESVHFYGTVSGSLLTVSEPGAGSVVSPDKGGPIKPGMTLQVGIGAVIQPYGTASTTGTGGVGTYKLDQVPGDVAAPITLACNWWSVPFLAIGSGRGGFANSAAHGATYVEGDNLYDYFVDLTGVSVNATWASGATTITINSITGSEPILPGMPITLAASSGTRPTGIPAGTLIGSQVSGTPNGAGVYNLVTGSSFPVLTTAATTTALGTSVAILLGAQALRMATSTKANAMTAWVTQPVIIAPAARDAIGNNGTGNGNPWVIKVGSTYYLFLEYFQFNTFPVEGSTLSWQTSLWSAASPSGPFSVVIPQLTTLRPTPNASVSHVRPYLEAATGQYVAYFHSQPWGRVLPSDLYRATIPIADIATDKWTLTNNKGPIMKRRHIWEVDQVADCDAIEMPDGSHILFYTAADNAAPSEFHIMGTRMFPMPQQRSSGRWVDAIGGIERQLQPNDQLGLKALSIDAAKTPPARTSDVWTQTVATAALGNGVLVSNGVTGNYASWTLGALWPGSYRVTILYRKGPDGGEIYPTMSESGAGSLWPVNPVGTLFVDSYAASLSENNVATFDFIMLGTEPFPRQIRFFSNTKHASSTGYMIGLTQVSIIKTSK
jgi:hypothetical protein